MLNHKHLLVCIIIDCDPRLRSRATKGEYNYRCYSYYIDAIAIATRRLSPQNCCVAITLVFSVGPTCKSPEKALSDNYVQVELFEAAQF